MGWRAIETAPKDGTVIMGKRESGELTFFGDICWRSVSFGALVHPIDGDIYAPADLATGWMYADEDKRFPEPTHWMPKQ